MTTGTKEFYEMRDQFEKDVQKMGAYFSGAVVREIRTEKTPVTVWYTNATVNAMFIAYMHGYASAKCNYQQ